MKEIIFTTMMVNEDNENIDEVNIEGYVHYTVDTNYGADADGNRGVQRTFVQDITDVAAYKQSGEDYNMTADEKYQAEQKLINRFFEGD